MFNSHFLSNITVNITEKFGYCYRVNRKKYPSKNITISQKCADIFVLNFAQLFRRQLCKSVLLCAVFTWHTPNWWKHKLQEWILLLYKGLILLLM